MEDILNMPIETPTPLEPEIYSDTGFELKITKLGTKLPSTITETYPNNTVFTVNWVLTGTYNNLQFDLQGVSNLSLPEGDYQFVQYENLTEELVISWIENLDVFIYHKHTVCHNLMKIVEETSNQLPW
jgi:hypothetical protein